ncbi:hypothetical protein B0H13DRAFT_1893904 [Mycena leptocephala]|nr:hypothetical protein B0H13DRAFT_1893904 [Mycena leptocephala]
MPIHAPLRIYWDSARIPMPRIHIGVPEDSAQRSAFFIGTRIGFGSGDTLGTKGALKSQRHAHRDRERAARIGHTPGPGTKREARLRRKELRANIEQHRCEPSPFPNKKENSKIDGRRKPEEDTPTPVEPEVRGERVERGGSGGGGLKTGGRDGERESKGIESMEEGETGEVEEWRRQRERRGNESNGRGYGRPAVLYTAHPPYARTNLKTKDSPLPYTPALQTSPPRLPDPPPPRERRKKAGAQHQAQERDQDDAIDVQCEVVGALERGVGEEEEWHEGVVHSLKQGREVRAQEEEEDVLRESEERGRRSTRSAEAGVDGPAEPDIHVLDFEHRRLGPADEGRFRAGVGEGDGGWRDR